MLSTIQAYSFEVEITSTYSRGMGDLSSLILVVKYLTCLRLVGTDRPATKPGLAGQEKAPHSSPIFLSVPLPE